MYQSARRNPTTFYIGLDANSRQLEKISEKTFRKPEKGGAANVLFIQAGVEDLPSELDGLANQIHINFPWGSLLRAIVLGDEAVLTNLRRICLPRARLEVVLSLDPKRDESEMKRLQIPLITEAYIDGELKRRFNQFGFQIVSSDKCEPATWPELSTSWGKKLRSGKERYLYRIDATAI